jgi:hypothetical protein
LSRIFLDCAGFRGFPVVEVGGAKFIFCLDVAGVVLLRFFKMGDGGVHTLVRHFGDAPQEEVDFCPFGGKP